MFLLPVSVSCHVQVNWISGLTVHRADPVAHGVADQVVLSVKHHKDLVHAELLGGQLRPDGLVVLAALEGDRLTPLVASGLDGAVGRGDGVVAVGGGSDHWGRGEEKNKHFNIIYESLL